MGAREFNRLFRVGMGIQNNPYVQTDRFTGMLYDRNLDYRSLSIRFMPHY